MILPRSASNTFSHFSVVELRHVTIINTREPRKDDLYLQRQRIIYQKHLSHTWDNFCFTDEKIEAQKVKCCVQGAMLMADLTKVRSLPNFLKLASAFTGHILMFNSFWAHFCTCFNVESLVLFSPMFFKLYTRQFAFCSTWCLSFFKSVRSVYFLTTKPYVLLFHSTFFNMTNNY